MSSSATRPTHRGGPYSAIKGLAFSHYNSLPKKEQALPARVVFMGAPAAIQFKPTHCRKIYRVSYRVFMRVW
jgi:hypothetical protein